MPDFGSKFLNDYIAERHAGRDGDAILAVASGPLTDALAVRDELDSTLASGNLTPQQRNKGKRIRSQLDKGIQAHPVEPTVHRPPAGSPAPKAAPAPEREPTSVQDYLDSIGDDEVPETLLRSDDWGQPRPRAEKKPSSIMDYLRQKSIEDGLAALGEGVNL